MSVKFKDQWREIYVLPIKLITQDRYQFIWMMLQQHCLALKTHKRLKP